VGVGTIIDDKTFPDSVAFQQHSVVVKVPEDSLLFFITISETVSLPGDNHG
jgi:hypothetical protein